jgi:hypothetical protein
MRRLPAGVTAQAVDGAKTALQEMTGTWNEAVTAQGSGNLLDAASKGAAVKSKAAELRAALGMK